ncbi:MAG: SMP-30/gluconolactonase/LRE family protein [Planctomycetaceae bacterium]
MKVLLPFVLIVVVALPTAFGDDLSVAIRNTTLHELWNDGEFTEGVAVSSEGKVFFSDIAKDAEAKGRVLMFDPDTNRTTVVCADSQKSNGLFFHQDGRLLACCGANGGAMALCEILLDGRVLPLVERFEGRRFNSPNDLVIHGDRVYFSDPRYIGPEPLELDHQSVYLYDLASRKLRRVTSDIQKPNGVQISPDGKTLYVAETNNGSTGQEPDKQPTTVGRMTLNAFRIAEDGSLSEKRVLVDFGDQLGTDGMAIDEHGNIFAAVRSPNRYGIIAYNPDGKERGRIATPTLPTNCCFGRGSNSTTLYITAGGGLYQTTLTAD